MPDLKQFLIDNKDNFDNPNKPNDEIANEFIKQFGSIEAVIESIKPPKKKASKKRKKK